MLHTLTHTHPDLTWSNSPASRPTPIQTVFFTKPQVKLFFLNYKGVWHEKHSGFWTGQIYLPFVFNQSLRIIISDENRLKKISQVIHIIGFWWIRIHYNVLLGTFYIICSIWTKTAHREIFSSIFIVWNVLISKILTQIFQKCVCKIKDAL